MSNENNGMQRDPVSSSADRRTDIASQQEVGETHSRDSANKSPTSPKPKEGRVVWTRQYVDDIDDAGDPHCGDAVSRECFIAGHFDWCLIHQHIANYTEAGKRCLHADADGNNCAIEYGAEYLEEDESDSESVEPAQDQTRNGGKPSNIIRVKRLGKNADMDKGTTLWMGPICDKYVIANIFRRERNSPSRRLLVAATCAWALFVIQLPMNSFQQNQQSEKREVSLPAGLLLSGLSFTRLSWQKELHGNILQPRINPTATDFCVLSQREDCWDPAADTVFQLYRVYVIRIKGREGHFGHLQEYLLPFPAENIRAEELRHRTWVGSSPEDGRRWCGVRRRNKGRFQGQREDRDSGLSAGEWGRVRARARADRGGGALRVGDRYITRSSEAAVSATDRSRKRDGRFVRGRPLKGIYLSRYQGPIALDLRCRQRYSKRPKSSKIQVQNAHATKELESG
ncbi:hypothetical protein PAAG_08273 [Paracoccidioides lutzii Pb01]|uniref:Uncharacterized protein n=1 Tax=Paracoccidioides lutzii (strain ATCC MYA-826 / Pb01) TaxID=502779 RepID=C1HBY2_PARBA|nr:hypothetical protein PAAG_08273 [Paracoccidioides lutzii Pb01]EEH38546.2 hypothetical protein PAAG_08273 [Paracoccidioides lutzii Pb01]